MVLTLNRHELEEMRVFARERGVHFHYDPLLNLGVGGNRAPAQYRLQAKDAVALDLTDPMPRRMAAILRQVLGTATRAGPVIQLRRGDRHLHIDAYGRMSACLMARQPAYDLRRGTFRSGWDDFMPRVGAEMDARDALSALRSVRALRPVSRLGTDGERRPGGASGLSVPDRPPAGGSLWMERWESMRRSRTRIVTEKPGDVTAFGLK